MKLARNARLTRTPLDEYRSKRAFADTPEPKGRVRTHNRTRIFVVQKHAASHLHYDFRLAINGVLVSWAVPKGPSMNPAEKRLAIRTEDHPMEYAEFEGVIPEGQYGAGTVMVWDRGTYESHESISPEEQLARGKIDVVLHGAKLRGGFTLVRTEKRSVGPRQKERWMLIKHRDECADPSWDIESARFERSILTRRSLKDIELSHERLIGFNAMHAQTDPDALNAMASALGSATPSRGRAEGRDAMSADSADALCIAL